MAGFSGTLLDSFLGAMLQASVVDVHSGKVIEGEGGRKVLIHGSSPLNMNMESKIRSSVVANEKGTGAVARTSAMSLSGTSLDNSIKASRVMQNAGASGGEVTDGQHESRKVAVGQDILDNNGVNLLMAATVSVGAMLVACAIWGLPLSSIVSL